MPLAFFLQPFGEDEPFLVIKVAGDATAFALDGLANLPESVSAVGLMCLVEGSIDAGTVQELVEELVIGFLVDGEIAFAALEIASGLLEPVDIRSGWMLLLRFQQ